MSKVVNVLKVILKVGAVIGLVVLVTYLLWNNRRLKKEHEKDQNIIKNYEQQYLGLGKDSVEEIPEAENEEIVEGIEYSTEEIQTIIQKVYSLEKRVEALEKGQQNSTTTVQSETAEETVKEVDVEESIKAYLSRKYPFDGNYYKEAGECQYYSDSFCTQKLDSKNLRFISQTTDYTSAENGVGINCVLTDNWQIVYSIQSPYLVTESEYDERFYQK